MHSIDLKLTLEIVLLGDVERPGHTHTCNSARHAHKHIQLGNGINCIFYIYFVFLD